MTKHTNEDLVSTWGAIETTTGVSIARMDRDEVRTSPTERDANAKRFVQIWNLWPDVASVLEDLYASQGFHSLHDDDRLNVWGLLKRVRGVE